jgi:hypothetical protein
MLKIAPNSGHEAGFAPGLGVAVLRGLLMREQTYRVTKFFLGDLESSTNQKKKKKRIDNSCLIEVILDSVLTSTQSVFLLFLRTFDFFS